jgi:hypothetical protein
LNRKDDNHHINVGTSMVDNYFSFLIGQFYKILPLRESDEPTLRKYMLSLQREMFGCSNVVQNLDNDSFYLSLLSIIQYLIDNECSVQIVKSEVFKAIDIINKLKAKYPVTTCGGD